MLALNLIGKKHCPSCDTERLRSEFSYVKSRGFSSHCKPCKSARERIARLKNPEPFRARDRARAPSRREWARSWRAENKEKVRAYERKTRYGIPHEEYSNLYRAQGGLCAVCKEPNKQANRNGRNSGAGSRDLHVDHDHATGRVRGLLCTNCNLGIGHFGDKPELLSLAIEYLKAPPTAAQESA